MRMKQGKRQKSLGRITAQLLIPVLLLFMGEIWALNQSTQEARSLVYRYIEDTAQLHVEQISREMVNINLEIATLMNRNKSRYASFRELRPTETWYYSAVGEVQDKLHNLKSRYGETSLFFLYLDGEDVLILDGGIAFPSSAVSGYKKALYEALRADRGQVTTHSEWSIFTDSGESYAFSRFCQNGVTMGCLVSLNNLFDVLHIDSLGYEGVPYFEEETGELFSASADVEKVAEGDGMIYTFPISGIADRERAFHLLVRQNGGLFDWVMGLQIFVICSTVAVLLGGLIIVWMYYQRILRPMRQFVGHLKNVEQEQWINENGQNNLLELEMASKEFRSLLRKIQSLKIDIYEKELQRKETELETLQTQLKPHFCLNCLSVIHGMADLAKEEKIAQVTELLSQYMRVVMGDVFTVKPLREELAFIENYVEIQRLRYGEDAFSFELSCDPGLGEFPIPALILYNFVENAVTHAVSLDSHVEISVYIVTETYEDGTYLYLCVSDTGKGFPEEILEAVREEKPIVYGGREHIGISNSVKRLRLLYGRRAKVTLSNMADGYGAVAELTIPAGVGVQEK